MNSIHLPQTRHGLRADLFTYFPLLQTKLLKDFLNDVFACDELVQAYLFPMRNQPPHAPRIVLAVDVATAIAREVRHSVWLQSAQERELAIVAALVKHCGHFLVALRHQPANSKEASQARTFALENALRNLRYSSPAMGQTLSAVLGQNAGDDIDSMQVTRIHNVLITAGMQRKLT